MSYWFTWVNVFDSDCHDTINTHKENNMDTTKYLMQGENGKRLAESIALSQEGYEKAVAMAENPPAPSERLIEAAKRFNTGGL